MKIDIGRSYLVLSPLVCCSNAWIPSLNHQYEWTVERLWGYKTINRIINAPSCI